jgi:ADP-heptose:LPS heptosyltransferase
MSDLEPASIRRARNHAGAVLTEWAAPILGSWARARCGPPTPPAEWRRLVILGSSHIGDVLFRTPSLPALRQALPLCHITYACEPLAADLLATNPNVDVTRSVTSTADLRDFDAALCTNHIAYHRDLMTATRAGIPNRVAFVHKGLSALASWPVRANYPRPAPAYTRAMIAAVTGLEPTWPLTPQIFLTDHDVAQAGAAWRELGLGPSRRDGGRPVVACTLTNRQPITKTWPVKSYLRTLELIARDSDGPEIVLCGSVEDAPLLHEAAAACAVPCKVLAGRLPLRAFAAFLQQCDVLLCSDSGPRHMANAVGTRVVFVRSLNVSRIEIGAYCDAETDACGDDEWLSPAAQDAALARLDPASVAALVARAL